MKKRINTNPRRGAKHWKAPSRMFWKCTRGMLPHKMAKGAAALGKLKVFEPPLGIEIDQDRMSKIDDLVLLLGFVVAARYRLRYLGADSIEPQHDGTTKRCAHFPGPGQHRGANTCGPGRQTIHVQPATCKVGGGEDAVYLCFVPGQFASMFSKSFLPNWASGIKKWPKASSPFSIKIDKYTLPGGDLSFELSSIVFDGECLCQTQLLRPCDASFLAAVTSADLGQRVGQPVKKQKTSLSPPSYSR